MTLTLDDNDCDADGVLDGVTKIVGESEPVEEAVAVFVEDGVSSTLCDGVQAAVAVAVKVFDGVDDNDGLDDEAEGDILLLFETVTDSVALDEADQLGDTDTVAEREVEALLELEDETALTDTELESEGDAVGVFDDVPEAPIEADTDRDAVPVLDAVTDDVAVNV